MTETQSQHKTRALGYLAGRDPLLQPHRAHRQPVWPDCPSTSRIAQDLFQFAQLEAARGAAERK